MGGWWGGWWSWSACPLTRSLCSHRMSWFSGFLVARVDDRKTAWGERNGKKSKRKGGSSLCNPRYMSCLRDPDAMEPPSGAPLHQHHRGGMAGAMGGGGNFGVRCGWQEDHYGKRGGALGEGVGLKSVDLGFEDGDLKGRKGGCNGGSGDVGDDGPNGAAGVVTAADCWLRVVQVFQSKKFQSRKLERLYQRYFFRLNQSSLTMLMGVLVIVCGIMLTFHCVHAAPHVAYSSALSVAMALFMALMVVCNRNGFHQDYMWMVSYLVIGVLVSVQVFGVLMVAPRSASEGIWWSVFFIYIIYTLLPVRMRAAVLSGAVLSVIHVVTTWQINQEDEFLWKQVSETAQHPSHLTPDLNAGLAPSLRAPVAPDLCPLNQIYPWTEPSIDLLLLFSCRVIAVPVSLRLPSVRRPCEPPITRRRGPRGWGGCPKVSGPG